MKGLLVRVAADQSEGGGSWNGPVNSRTGEFVYVSIPESGRLHEKLKRSYAEVSPTLERFGWSLPAHLAERNMHLDPDFEHLTYGDGGERAKQIRTKLSSGDLIVFYGSLKDILPSSGLVYGIIGIYLIDEILYASEVPQSRWHENAHTRRVLPGAGDIVVRARQRVSGRLEKCIPIGSYRKRAYRVRPSLLNEWGGIGIKDGYLQRSARLPELLDADNFYRWFLTQGVSIIPRNN